MFPGGEGQLEGCWHLPTSTPAPVVVVCHPHPLYGGDMHNNVVLAVCRALAGHGVSAFRFNFRGVGRSDGEFGGGVGEQEDTRAALDFALTSPNADGRAGLAGYSFGGSVSLPVAMKDERISLLALVSPALRDGGWEKLREYARPVFVIVGDADDIVSVRLPRAQAGGPVEVVPGADHFWWGREADLAGKVAGFFIRGFHL